MSTIITDNPYTFTVADNMSINAVFENDYPDYISATATSSFDIYLINFSGTTYTWKLTSGTNYYYGNVAGWELGNIKKIYGKAVSGTAAAQYLTSLDIRGCYNLQIIDSYETWGQAFYSLGKLSSVKLPSSVITIGNQAFRDCTNAVIDDLPPNVVEIGQLAFSATKLSSTFTIPSTVNEVSRDSFINTPWWDARANNSLIYKDNIFLGYKGTASNFSGTKTITSGTRVVASWALYTCTNITKITLPETVIYIGKSAFRSCSSLSSINLPNSIISIGSQTFESCSNLTSITLPNSLTIIPNNLFYGCSKLTSISIPDTITDVKYQAFYNCNKLTSITLPDTVSSIGESCFKACSVLSEFNCKATTPPTLGNYAFDSTSSNLKIYVPTASVNAYKSASRWSNYSSKIYGKSF